VTSSRRDRLPWEYADGPDAGRDVPITSDPREEEAPGVPAPAPDGGNGEAGGDGAAARGGDAAADGGGRAGSGASGTEEREVRSEDPELSPETNERVTGELRDVVGSERVRVPTSRPHASRGEHPQQHGPIASLNMNRFQIVRATAIVLTFAAIISLITGDWWLLPLAAGVHALGTMTVTLTIVRMTTVSEHPAPDVAAALTEEGIRNPDEHFSRMVEEFREQPDEEAAEGGATEVISPGHNEREVPAHDDTAAASAEQSSAMTPTGQPSHPSGAGGAPDILIWSTALSLLVLSIVLPAAGGGGWLWLTTAVMVPLLIGWMLLQRLIATRGEEAHVHGRGPMIAIVVCTAAAVAVFCALVALAFQH
jgi:hypothetical protein